MNTILKHILLVLICYLLVSCSAIKINNNEQGYSLLFTRDTYKEGDLIEFYVDDIDELKKISKSWTFTKKSPYYLCGYDYTVYLTQKGVTLNSYSITLDCEEIVTKHGAFFFDKNKMKDITKRKLPIRKIFTKDTLIKARESYQNLLSDEKLIYCSSPDWLKYEGTFLIYQKESDFKLDKEEKILLRKIDKVITNEQYELIRKSYSSVDGVTYIIKCNYSFYEKFNITDKSEWSPYTDLSLISYWKR